MGCDMDDKIELKKSSADVLILFMMLIAFVAGYILGEAMGQKSLKQDYERVVEDLNSCNVQKGWVIDNFYNNQYTKIPFDLQNNTDGGMNEQERI